MHWYQPVTLGGIDEDLYYQFLVDSKNLESTKRFWLLRGELEKNFPFSTFPDYVNDRIVRPAQRKEIPAGTTVIEQGQQESDFYIVISGLFEVSQGGIFINELKPGDFFGEYGALAEKVRNATVATKEDSVVLVIHRNEISQIVSDTPRLLSFLNQLIRSRSEEVRRIKQEVVGKK